MKKALKFSAALPLLLIASACSSDVDAPERLEGSYDVVMTITDGGTRAVKPLSTEIQNLKKENLAFATYSASGTKKHWLFQGSTDTANNAVKAFYFLPNWGPSVACELPKEEYAGNYILGCFNVPNELRAKDAGGFSVMDRDLNNTDMNLLEWPGKKETGYIWNPDKTTDETLIPMAGIVKVTAEHMAKYNPDIYNTATTPFRLPDIQLTRALAKVVIVDLDNIIAKVEVKSPKYGSLTPERTGWLAGNEIVRPLNPTLPTGKTQAMLTQTLETPSYQNADEQNVYEFYTFEQSFYDASGKLADVAADIRKVVTLYANAASGLIGTTRETTTVRFAPYKDGMVNTEADLNTADQGAWQGVKRNLVYTFYISKPPVGGLHIVYKVQPWEKTTDTFTF